MSDYGRVSRLRALISELERAAPSDERDAVLRSARDRLSALELDRQEPSAWPLHRRGLTFPPSRRQVRPEYVERAEFVLD